MKIVVYGSEATRSSYLIIHFLFTVTQQRYDCYMDTRKIFKLKKKLYPVQVGSSEKKSCCWPEEFEFLLIPCLIWTFVKLHFPAVYLNRLDKNILCLVSDMDTGQAIVWFWFQHLSAIEQTLHFVWACSLSDKFTNKDHTFACPMYMLDTDQILFFN